MGRTKEHKPEARARGSVPKRNAVETATPVDAAPAAARAEARAELALRIQRVAEREMDAIDRILTVLDPVDQAEADRCARTLAGIARTLREVTALNEPEKPAPADDPESDDIPIDLDQLRDELARALNELIEARSANAHGDSRRAGGSNKPAQA